MNTISLLPLLAAAIIFSSGLWALISLPKRQLTRLFFLLCLIGAIWSFSIYELAGLEPESNSPWETFGFVWLLIFPVQLHFVYLYSEIEKTRLWNGFVLVIYLISIMFGWLLTDPTSEGIWPHIWPLLLALVSLVFAARIYMIGSANRKKVQELMVMIGVSGGLVFCVGVVLDQTLDMGSGFVLPLILSIEALLISIGLVRHDLIKFSPFTAMESIMAALTDAVILTTSGGMIVTANRAALDILGYREIELVDQPIGSVVGQVWKGDFLPGEDDFGIEMALIAKDKTRIPVTLSTSVVTESSSSPQGVVFVARDLTKRVHAQEQLINALKEKEILLKETHHRVKNNLQVISSLLSIQGDYLTDPQAMRVLEESRDRVFSMAVVHELLYQSEDLREIDLKDYTDRLIEHIIFSHSVSLDQISFHANVSEISLDLDSASYIGLVINELIVNALVHGFPEGRRGDIYLDLSRQGEGRYELAIKDTGVGLPQDFNLTESDSLGLQLVAMITDQIDGDLVIEQGKGTTFKLSFHRLDEAGND